ncbi:hypothetical protein Btru_062740 [Bulinus truncatus]|nr:hypothetical protein Btru_062740 [Bulinus truncatus]
MMLTTTALLVAISVVTPWKTAQLCSGQTYNETKDLFNFLINYQNYHTEVRPVLDQDKVIFVDFFFQLLSIVEVNDVAQSFVTNGFLSFNWQDEILVWNVTRFGGQTVLHPLPEKIWRPRVLMINTLEDRDLFDDDKAPVFVYSGGSVTWAPGSLFPASCELKMTKFPFDKHTCMIQMVAMSYSSDELQFTAMPPTIGMSFYTDNGEWELQETYVTVSNMTSQDTSFSSFELTFTIARRPLFLLLNIFLPIVFLSFLNLLVFVIPVESGMKINYGITVLLALTTFMSSVSSMLPRSSLSMAKVVFYLFAILIISMLTVTESIIIVFLGHLDEKESHKHESTAALEQKKLDSVSRTKEDGDKKNMSLKENTKDGRPPWAMARSRTFIDKRLKVIGQYVDWISFIVFFIVWLGLTLGVFVNISYF